MTVRAGLLQSLFLGGLVLAIVGSCAAWLATRERLPRKIRIATGAEKGFNHILFEQLKPDIERRLGRPIEMIVSEGSQENRTLVLQGRAELGVIQVGAAEFDGLAGLAPLYRDVVHVVVRRSSGIRDIAELRGKRIVLGQPRSGMRSSAIVILEHHGIREEDLHETERYFGDLLTVPALDGAIVTTSFLNGDLQQIMARPDFELLPIRHAEAIALHHPYFAPRDIPAGVFEGRTPVPPEPVPSVDTLSVLVARGDVPTILVQRTLEALDDFTTTNRLPTLLTTAAARTMSVPRQHPAARSFYNPYEGLGLLSNILESISAMKELLVALGAAMLLLWDRWRRMRQREHDRLISQMKERLDVFLEETVRVEREQLTCTDVVRLGQLLDQVTHIKLQALSELTHEDLRGDRMFSIFLMQCGDLSAKTQAKLVLLKNDTASERGV